jgi:hypothetical protein
MADLNTNSYFIWRYLLSIENMLVTSRQYCEIATSNHDAYSDEYTKIIILSSIHFEYCAKLLSEEWSPGTDTSNMGKARTFLMSRRSGMSDVAVGVSGTDVRLVPLSDWKSGRSSGWWDAYTDIKHNYGAAIVRGSQINALNAIAGCLVCILYYFEKHRVSLWPHCSILEYDQPPVIVDDSIPPLPR